MQTRRRLALWTGLLTLTACGQGHSVSGTEALYEKVSWYFQCATDPNPIIVPAPTSDRHAVLEGPGPFSLFRERMFGVPVEIIGKICPPTQVPRDIVFVIDVSGSMLRSDTLVDNPTTGTKRCGRLDAIEAVIGTLPATANYAIATFDDAQEMRSDRLYADKNALLAQIGGGNAANAYQNICTGIGNTSYTAGLSLAKDLLEGGRPAAMKEIFFLTDGEPTDATSQITALADDLKADGVAVGGQSIPVSIATVMLGTASDAFLKTVASRNSEGQPIHGTAATANQLADVFQRLAKPDLAGSVVKHGAAANPAQQIDVMPHLQAHKFALPPFTLDLDLSQRTYAIELEYWDSRHNKSKVAGTINWAD